MSEYMHEMECKKSSSNSRDRYCVQKSIVVKCHEKCSPSDDKQIELKWESQEHTAEDDIVTWLTDEYLHAHMAPQVICN